MLQIKKDIKTKFVRAELLKNVKEAVRIYEVITNDISIQPPGSAPEVSKKKKLEKSIAVLPFVDMSSSHDQEYLGDGLAEEILNSIVHLKDLKVAGRTSSSQFKGRNIDLREVGEKLGVSTVLEGSVRKQGDRLRITAQLINVEDGFHIWSERYDRDMDDIFAIQDEIALAITEQLKITLIEKDREKIIKTSTHNAEAYELYLKGMFHTNRRGSSALIGLEYFNQAIAIDPGYALAYTGLAAARYIAAFYSYFPGREVMQKMKQVIETAIELDNSRCEPYVQLGNYYVCLEYNWAEAEKNYLKSIEINPGFSQAHALYGMACLGFWQGKFDEAERQGRIATKLEPLSAIDYADLAWTLFTAHKFEEALQVAKTGIEIDANSFLSQRVAGLCYIALHRYNEAIKTFQNLLKISNRNQHVINSLIWAYCSNENFDEARILMNELEERSKTQYIAGTYWGLSAAWLGDVDQAFFHLENALNDHDPILITLKYAPLTPQLLSNDARFQKFIR